MSWNSGAGEPDKPKNITFEVEIAGTHGLTDEQKEIVTDFFCDEISRITDEWKQKALEAVESEKRNLFTPEERQVLTDGILRMMDQDPNEFRETHES